MADFVPSIFRFYVILSSPMPVDWFCAIYFGWVNIWWEKLYIIIFYIFFRYFFILATDWFCAIYFRWVNIWLGKLYIFVFHIFLVIFASWQLIDFASYISGGKIFDEKNCIFLYSNGCLKKLSFTELSICRFATNNISISSQLAAGSPNAQFGKTQFFWDTPYIF